ncbi:MAG TPA: carboxypeptidase-like regulatory domain-containing protein [Nitrospiria bacterium]|jgi:hypothetical protein
MMAHSGKVFIGCLVAVIFGISDSYGYTGTKVGNGGKIHGRVILKGPVPEHRAFPIVLYPFGSYCKKISNGEGLILLKEFNVDLDGGLQDAVVAVQGVTKGKRFRSKKNQFVAINCMFHPADVPEDKQFELHAGRLTHVHPLVSIMRNHRRVSVVNKDPVLHGGQIYQPETGHRVLSFPVPVSGGKFGGTIHLGKGKKIVQMICPMHEFMQSWGWIVDNPYFAKTQKGGGYLIDDLLPGKYKVTAWHPHLKPIEKEFTILEGRTVSIDFEFDPTQVVRPLYETQEHFRIPPESDPFQDLEGCEDPFCVKRD